MFFGGTASHNYCFCIDSMGTRAPPTMSDLTGNTRNSKGESYNLKKQISRCWKEIGRAIGLNENQLSGIQDKGDQDARFIVVMDEWINNANGLRNKHLYPHSWVGLYSLICAAGVSCVADTYIEQMKTIIMEPDSHIIIII